MRPHAINLSLVAFSLHLAWEYSQCIPFFLHGSVTPTHSAMLIATLGDVGITWVLYGAIAIKRGNWLWVLNQWKASDVIVMLVLALAIAIGIELRALASGRWRYTPLTHLVPGTSISLVPLLQLILLTPLIFWIAKRLTLRAR